MRLGALVSAALDLETLFDLQVLREIDDVDLVEKIERYVLTGQTASSAPTEEPPGSSGR